MTPLDKAKALEAHLRSLDSASGEAVVIAKLIAVAEAAQKFHASANSRDLDALASALAALTTPEAK